MNWIVANIKGIMLVSGIITCSMILSFFAPQEGLKLNFGESIDGPIAQIVVRNWGALIAMVGGMLIYGAYRPVHRGLILTCASISKAIFILLILIHGQAFLSVAMPALIFDSVAIALYVVYLISSRSNDA
jgi:hypothetical protein